MIGSLELPNNSKRFCSIKTEKKNGKKDEFYFKQKIYRMKAIYFK